MNRPITIRVDARCLQDEAYKFRGVGRHAAVVLHEARNAFSRHGGVRLSAILDRQKPDLETEHAELFDACGYTCSRVEPDDWFLALSPMTHSPIPLAGAFTGGARRKAAIVYDFIPYREPQRYLRSPDARTEYLQCLGWLARHDLFQCISQYTADELAAILTNAPGEAFVSGVAVRSTVVQRRRTGPVAPPEHYLVVGGGDTRKNAEVAVAAHARCAHAQQNKIPLYVAGGYPPSMSEPMRAHYAASGGDPALLRFLSHISDGELAHYYRKAFVTVCPSRSEGFSIPVVEANANDCPVVVSSCPAQTELVGFPEDHFEPDDVDRVVMLMERATRPQARSQMLARQRDLWRKFESRAVGERFWRPFLDSAGREAELPAAPTVSRRRLPKLAFLTPLPPDPSGVADYTAASLESLCAMAEVHLFTETAKPRIAAACAGIHRLSALPFVSRSYDAVVSVVGNSHFHKSTIDLLLDYGGAAIAHDARMINYYAIICGPERATAIASREMGRPVEWPEVAAWLHDQRRLSVPFLSEVLDAAQPTIVHSRETQQIVRDLFDQETAYLPFTPYRVPLETDCTPAAKDAARRRLGLDGGEFLISSFGMVAPDKAPQACVWTVQQLKAWGVRAKFAFVGSAYPAIRKEILALAEQIGVLGDIIIFDETVGEDVYNDFLKATDMAVQLRTYRLGALSGGLLDCAAYGVPTVATATLAKAVDAPPYIKHVPFELSPVLVAEQLITGLEEGARSRRPLEARKRYLAEKSFEAYGRELLRVVGAA